MTIKLFKQSQDVNFPFRHGEGHLRVIFKQYYTNDQAPSWMYRSFKTDEALKRFVQGEASKDVQFVYKKPVDVFLGDIVSHFAREAAEQALKGHSVTACTLSMAMGGKPLEFEFSSLDARHIQAVYAKQMQALERERAPIKVEEGPSP